MKVAFGLVLLAVAGCARARARTGYPCDLPPLTIRIDGPCAWTPHSQALVLIVGTRVGRYWQLVEGRIRLDIRRDDIISVQTVKAGEAAKRYGPDDTYGALLILTTEAPSGPR